MHMTRICDLRYGDKLARNAVYPKGSIVTKSLLDVLYSKSIQYVWIEDDKDYDGPWKRFQADYEELKGFEVYELIDEILGKNTLIPDTLTQMLVDDRVTLVHSINVASMTWDIAHELSLPEKQIEEVIVASLLHDIGKLCVPSSILQKPGKLTDIEFDTVKRHPKVGREILDQYDFMSEDVKRGVAEHHEKWDGSGYYQNLSCYNIHLFARIIAIADVFDALVSKRSYKKQYDTYTAISIMREDVGHFDIAILEEFLHSIESTSSKGVNILRIS